MPLSDIERSIEALVQPSSSHSKILESLDGDNLRVIKYISPKHLAVTLLDKKLYASNTPGHSWGDAAYVAPVACPRATMMYGAVGIVGTIDLAAGVRFFDATDPHAIDLYQQWISYARPLFLQLTTTVHANYANRKLRNMFRGRFQIDCVIFRPDEHCTNYAEPNDLWLALTHWSPTGEVAHGATKIVKDLRWCVIGTDTFESEGLGYKAAIYPGQSTGKTFIHSAYSSLEAAVMNAYNTDDQIIITNF